MSDIVTRLRDWPNVHLARLHLLMEEAADEVERLSQKCDCPESDNAAKQDNTPAAHDTLREGREQNGCTLTDAEREAIESAIWDYQQNDAMVATLERMLERME